MHAASCIPIAVVAVGLTAAPLAAQAWVPHQPPCRISTGHFLVNGAVMQLRQAVEARYPDQRASRLGEAQRILLRAILEAGQAKNPAAWYYLGRYYYELSDPVGADTAFHKAVALAPDCAADVAGYTTPLAGIAMNDALRTWGAEQRDSAIYWFRVAGALDPADAEIPLYMATMYAATAQPDSAERYLEEGMAVAAADTAHAARRRQATLEVARAWETRAYEEPAVRSIASTRAARDSTAAAAARDSALLAKAIADVAQIRAGGRELNPRSRAAFERDSTTIMSRWQNARQRADSLAVAAAAESTAVVAALAPAIRAYQRYTTAYPDDVDAAVQLMRHYATMGDRAALDAAAAAIAASPQVSASALVPGGLGLYGDGYAAPAAVLLEGALERNRYEARALAALVHVYHDLRRAEPLHDVAVRLQEIDPLNPATPRAMAVYWDVAGVPDSVTRYLAVADTGLGWHVTMSQFSASERTAALNGSIRNATGHPLAAMTLVVEFLGASGEALATERATVPELAPGARQALAVRVERGGVVAWRYRRE